MPIKIFTKCPWYKGLLSFKSNLAIQINCLQICIWKIKIVLNNFTTAKAFNNINWLGKASFSAVDDSFASFLQMHGPVQEPGMDSQGDKKSNTPSPFEGPDGDRGDEKQENLPPNALLQNGLDEDYR